MKYLQAIFVDTNLENVVKLFNLEEPVGDHMEGYNTCSLIKNILYDTMLHGNKVKRKVGSWCMKKDDEVTMLERYGVNLVLKSPMNCITSQHCLSCEIETEDYFLGLNPGFVEYSDWSFYTKFKQENDFYPYTYGDRMTPILNTYVSKLKEEPTSRQLVISIWDNIDDIPKKFVPCNVTMKIELSKDKLNMFVINRSQDLCRGIFLDTFAYPMIQQIICRNNDIKLGRYYHYIMNAHIYENDLDFAKRIYSSLRNEKPLEISDKLSEQDKRTMLQISQLIFSDKRKQTQTAQYLAKRLPDFWFNWKANQIIYSYSKYHKKDPMPTAITCAGVIINENPGKL